MYAYLSCYDFCCTWSGHILRIVHYGIRHNMASVVARAYNGVGSRGKAPGRGVGRTEADEIYTNETHIFQ